MTAACIWTAVISLWLDFRLQLPSVSTTHVNESVCARIPIYTSRTVSIYGLIRMFRCEVCAKYLLIRCVCVSPEGLSWSECGATAVLQIRAHLLVTESLKPAHLIKHNAHGQIPFTPFTLITQSTGHTHTITHANTQSHMHTHTHRCTYKHTISCKAKPSVSIGMSIGGG